MISLYARGCEDFTIEVGRFDMSMTAATDAFLAVCNGLGVMPKVVDAGPGQVGFRLPFKCGDPANYKILDAVANVGDVRGDPPMFYYLTEVVVPAKGGYAKTDSVYSD